MTSTPAQLYRFRPLTNDLLDRELDALKDSYLFSPLFSEMNDPMEAFYQIGGPEDKFINQAVSGGTNLTGGIYKILADAMDRAALVSFSSTYKYLPMWAYYANNFAGMCLEFNTNDLLIGDFQNEEIKKSHMPRTHSHL